MILKNRTAAHPGRVTLKDVDTGAEKTYDITMADGATEQGTPLNAEMLNEFKEDVLNNVMLKTKFVLSGTTLTINL